jgi:hypothetical protein
MNAFRALVNAIQTLPNNSSSLKPQLNKTVNAMRTLKAAKAANPNAAPAPAKKSLYTRAVNSLTALKTRLTPGRVQAEGNKVANAISMANRWRRKYPMYRPLGFIGGAIAGARLAASDLKTAYNERRAKLGLPTNSNYKSTLNRYKIARGTPNKSYIILANALAENKNKNSFISWPVLYKGNKNTEQYVKNAKNWARRNQAAANKAAANAKAASAAAEEKAASNKAAANKAAAAKKVANAKAAVNARIAQIRKLNTEFKKAKTTVQKIALANAMNSLMGANITNMNTRTIVTSARNAAEAAREANKAAEPALAQKRIDDTYKKFIQEVWPRTVGRGMGNAWQVKKVVAQGNLTPIITKYFTKNTLNNNNKQKIISLIPMNYNGVKPNSIIGWQGLMRRPDRDYNKRKNYLKKILNINQTP